MMKMIEKEKFEKKEAERSELKNETDTTYTKKEPETEKNIEAIIKIESSDEDWTKICNAFQKF